MSKSLKGKPLAAQPPAKGTTSWNCPRNGCVDSSGKPSSWPLRVITSRKPLRTSKTAICPRCRCSRAMTDGERALIEGNPFANPPVPGTIGVIHRHASQLAMRNNFSFVDVAGLAYWVACTAAMTFDPANGFKFSTYLTLKLRYDCSPTKIRMQLQGIRLKPMELVEYRGPRSACRYGESVPNIDQLADSSNRENECKERQELLESTLRRAGISARDREILLQRFGHGQTLEQIGQRFGIPTKDIGRHIAGLVGRVKAEAITVQSILVEPM
ncbi:MAG: sigma factor-like helix-turn-helix DNA-binding protein [Gemmataceae bacterium]